MLCIFEVTKNKEMKNLETNILIKAEPQTVWQILMDFEKHPEWNPFFHTKGEAKVGAYLHNTMHLEGQKPQVFKPKVLKVEEAKEFRWKGKLLMSGLFDGEHYFKLEQVQPGQTKLIHGENFSGILVGLLWSMIGEATEQGFRQMNEALKKKAESVSSKQA